jgi:RNA 2',3'-cyclic 3'-phosphodiesterase
MRLFLAIPLNENVTSELKRLIARLRPTAPDLRWSQPESWHITLQFLGNTSEEQLQCILPRISALEPTSVAIEFEALGVFDRAGVFFLGVRPTLSLISLHKSVVATTRPCGFEPEDRPYRPHITLARSKSGVKAGDLRRLPGAAGQITRFEHFFAAEFLLYESHLSTSGSTYEVKNRFPLGKRA